MLTAHQEYYYTGTNHAMITTVLAVQGSRRTTVSMTAWLDLMKSLSNKMRPTISMRTYKTALILVVVIVTEV